MADATRREFTATVAITYDPRQTDEESLCTALDTLMTTALSTPGILDDYGPVDVGDFYPAGVVAPEATQALIPWHGRRLGLVAKQPNEVALAVFDRADEVTWFLATLTPQGRLSLHAGIAAGEEFQTDSEGRLLADYDLAEMPPSAFPLTERGNTWLTSDGDHNAWLRLGDNLWLEISIRLDNYPGLNVNLLEASPGRLAAHIRKECGGMYIRKLNLDGVRAEDGAVVGDEEL
jgi:hypothetical protein